MFLPKVLECMCSEDWKRRPGTENRIKSLAFPQTNFGQQVKCFTPTQPSNYHQRVRGKEPAYSVGDLGSIPGLGRSPEEGNGNPLQYSCLENPMDGGSEEPDVLQSMGSQRVGQT